MSETVETEVENDIDVRDVENSNTEVIKAMMQQWSDGKLTDAQDTFNDILGKRADDAIAVKKADMAASMFDTPEGEIIDASDMMPDQTGEEPEEETEESEEETEESETETEQEEE